MARTSYRRHTSTECREKGKIKPTKINMRTIPSSFQSAWATTNLNADVGVLCAVWWCRTAVVWRLLCDAFDDDTVTVYWFLGLGTYTVVRCGTVVYVRCSCHVFWSVNAKDCQDIGIVYARYRYVPASKRTNLARRVEHMPCRRLTIWCLNSWNYELHIVNCRAHITYACCIYATICYN